MNANVHPGTVPLCIMGYANESLQVKKDDFLKI